MQGNTVYSGSKRTGTFHSWIEKEFDEIKYQLFEKAKDFISDLAEGPFDGNLKLNTNRWSYLSSRNKKEGYKGFEEIDANGIPVIKLTFNSFKHGGHTETFNSYAALKELWQQKKLGCIEKPKANYSSISNKTTNTQKNEAQELQKILEQDKSLWKTLKKAGQSEYLNNKKLSNLAGVRFAKEFIAVSIINTDGCFFGLQRIFNNGFKLFTKGLQKKGNFAVIGSESLPERLERVHICEGISTAGSIHMATLEPVFAAMDAFNLEFVAKNLKEKYPKAQIIIWADNDAWKENNLDSRGNELGNTGLIYANLAAIMARTAVVATPNFSKLYEIAKEKKLTDFNDLHVYGGLSELENIVPSKPNINLALSKKTKKLERIFHGILSPGQLFDANKTTINSKYIADFKIQEGVNLIRSPIGTGKTELVEKYIKEHRDSSVIFLTHLVSLVEDASSRLELKSYSECDNFDLQMQKRIAICLNSIGKLTAEGDLPEYDLLVIDEIEQVLNRLSSKLDQKTLVFSILKQLIISTKTVVCLDAHLSDTTMSLIKKWCGNKKVNILFNEYKVGQGRNIILYNNKESLQVKALQEIKNNQNAYLTFNSKNEAKKVFNLLQNALPDKKGLFISSDNNGDKDVRDFFNNVNEESKKYNYIICTPSISTGVSISNGHFKFIAGVFNADINTPNDCMQAIGRVRGSLDIHIYTEKRRNNKPLNPEVIARTWNETHKYDMELMGLSDNGKRIIICPDYEFIRTKTTQNKNRGLNDFFYEFCLLNKLDDYNIKYSDFCLTKFEIDDIKAAKTYFIQTTNQNNIAFAQDIDKKLANIIERKSRKTSEETLSFEKHKLIEFYKLNRYSPNEIKDYVLLDNYGKLKRKVLNLEITLNDQNYAKKLFENQLEEGEQFSADLKRFATKQLIYQKLLSSLKLIDEEGEFILNTYDCEYIYNKDDLLNSSFFEWLRTNYKVAQGVMSLPSIERIEKEPIRFVSKLLSDLGLKQKRVGKNENGNYSINSESVQFMTSILNRRGYFQGGDSCSIKVINNTRTVPETTVPQVLFNLGAVVDAYSYFLNKTLLELKNKLKNRKFGNHNLAHIMLD